MSNKTLSLKDFNALMEVDVPRYVIWDIETGPLPLNDLAKFKDSKKIKFPAPVKPFDHTSVKYGNIKDATKRQLKLAEERRKHAEKAASYEHDCAAAVEAYMQQLQEDAPLKSHLNVVLAIGYGILMSDGDIQIYLDFSKEKELTQRLWYVIDRVKKTKGNNYTWNGNGFDIPIMTQKAWKYDIEVPYLLTKYRKLEDFCIDALDYYKVGGYQAGAKLSEAAKFFNVAGKLEGMTGDQFWKVLAAGQKDLAREYLECDINATFQVCKKMGLLDMPFLQLKSYLDANTKGK